MADVIDSDPEMEEEEEEEEDDGEEELSSRNTRKLVAAKNFRDNVKKKRSGGFQSMGEWENYFFVIKLSTAESKVAIIDVTSAWKMKFGIYHFG